uniref:Putative secreted peptide n=1 Tax=Anopheles braziliensis TaxID=58242 RepID=A0A2M3ZXE7_9DIPT
MRSWMRKPLASLCCNMWHVRARPVLVRTVGSRFGKLPAPVCPCNKHIELLFCAFGAWRSSPSSDLGIKGRSTSG